MMLVNFVKIFVGGLCVVLLQEVCWNIWVVWFVLILGEYVYGCDFGYEDVFFELKDEVIKLFGIDDGLIICVCEQLFKEIGKDLWLVGYYVFV